MCSMNTIVSERIVRVFLKMPVGNFDVYVNTAPKAVPSSNSYRLDITIAIVVAYMLLINYQVNCP